MDADLFRPRLAWLQRFSHYSLSDLRHDAVSGATVMIMGIPQAMAYAMIAGLPPVYGIYTSIFSAILAALLGSCSHLVTGPTNASCMIVLSVSAPFALHADRLEVVLLLAFMTGLVKISFGLLRMGGTMRYVSNSVLVGFTAGAGILIAAGQIKNLIGVSVPESESMTFVHTLGATLGHWSETNYAALAIGLLTAAIMVVARRVSQRLPRALIAVIAASAASYLLGWANPDAPRHVTVLRDIGGGVQGSLDLFRIPLYLRPSHFDWDLFSGLTPGALALGLMGLVQASSSARAVSARSGQRVNYSREFAAQGLTNMAGSFFQNFAADGSFTRTALCWQSGGRTRMAPAFSGIFTAVALVCMAPFINLIAKASLAGMLMVIALSMVERGRLLHALRAGLNSRIVMFVTLVSTLVLPLQYAIFVGVFLSIAMLLRITAKPDLTVLVPREDGKFDEVPFDQAAGDAPILLVNLEGDFYFAAVENLDYVLLKAITPQTRVVQLRMKRLRAAGSSGMAILEHFYDLLCQRGVQLVVCGIEKGLESMMTSSGLREKIGEQNLFYADNTIFQSTELALARSRAIVEMERRRLEAARTHAAPTADLAALPRAREIMSRRCVRFGKGHSIREAVWLISEMNRRYSAVEPQPLFLQDTEGKLAGEVTQLRLLDIMTEGLDLSADDLPSDAALGRHILASFEHIVGTVAERSETLPIGLGTTLGELLSEAVRHDETVLPVRDDNGRLIGLVSQHDLLLGVGRMLHIVGLREKR